MKCQYPISTPKLFALRTFCLREGQCNDNKVDKVENDEDQVKFKTTVGYTDRWNLREHGIKGPVAACCYRGSDRPGTCGEDLRENETIW